MSKRTRRDSQMQYEEPTVDTLSGRLEELVFLWVHFFGDGHRDPFPFSAMREVRHLRRSVAMIRLLVVLTVAHQLTCAMLDYKMFKTKTVPSRRATRWETVFHGIVCASHGSYSFASSQRPRFSDGDCEV